MRITLLTIICFAIFNVVQAQEVSCGELYNYVIDNYRYPSTVNCFGSELLVKVQRYDVDGTGFVVAYIKQTEYDFRGKPYIFCGISSYNWSMFRSGGFGGSWGESFHKYIMDYKCNCY